MPRKSAVDTNSFEFQPVRDAVDTVATDGSITLSFYSYNDAISFKSKADRYVTAMQRKGIEFYRDILITMEDNTHITIKGKTYAEIKTEQETLEAAKPTREQFEEAARMLRGLK